MKRPNLLLFFIIFWFSCYKPKFQEKKAIDNIFYDKAFEYRDSHNSDSAFFYFNKAKDFYLQQKDSLGIGKCLLNMAIISTDKGDYLGGQELSLNAIPYFNEHDKKQVVYIISNFNNLGLATQHLENYNQAITFYQQSLKYATDSTEIAVIKNNIANTYRRIKDYKKAIEIYQIALKQNAYGKNFARTSSNLAFNRWLQNPHYNALPEFLKALDIQLKENDLLGQNASYSHLADYYTEKQPDSALIYAKKMYLVSKAIYNPDSQLQALEKLIRLSPQKSAKQYFEIYRELDDSVENSRHAAKNQFALIRYETEKHKADFQKAQTENIQKQNSILKLYIVLAILTTFLVFGFMYYKRRKKRLQQEKILEIKNTELKYSRKVHDVVANGLYTIMLKLDHQEALKDDPIVDEIEELYEKSRDISYELPKLNAVPFNEKLTELIYSFRSENIKIKLSGNTANLWKNVNTTAKHEIEHVLQELMVNMKKHSGATQVQILFQQSNQDILIHYIDNGTGLPKNTSFKNGLTNTGNRIKNISGNIIFDTQNESGLEIHISFPIS
ncbi:tetratricopeptide repeat protein [Pedobacter sp. ASV28]|uniref:tetratricopeptide repeat-containing sensor histidine kinase n=1 Tax=Pedobacter sp. ASV28 TaxID=2795123 RepID=UPI00351C463B